MQLLAALDTRGGHILILLLLTLIGAGMTKLGLVKGEDIMIGSFTGLLVAMRGKGGPNGDGDATVPGPAAAPKEGL
jgi:hypothetical protein